MSRALVLLFAKAPVAGKVKRRLAATIGEEAALAFYSETLRRLALALSSPAEWDLEIAVTPDPAAVAPFFRGLSVRTHPQGGGDLGVRLLRPLALAAPERPVIVLGSDVPEITPDHLRDAIEALAAHNLAIGPSPDGGYWLIGASRPPPADLFDGVRWSSPHARADTLAGASGLSVATLAWLEDIDDDASYRRWLTKAETARA